MGNKLTNLDVSLFDIGGSNFLGVITAADFNVDVLTELCKSIEDRHDSEKAFKKDLKWNCTEIPHVTGECQSNLNLSVFTVDGTSYVGEFNTCDIDVTTKIKQTDGAAELFRWNQAMGTGVTITLDKFVAANTDLFQRALSGDIADIEVQLVINVGSVSLTLPMTMTAAKHSWENDSEQMENVTFKSRGAPVAASGDALFIEILTGDAYVAWAVETGGGNYSGNAIIESAKLTIGNGALQKGTFGFANQGQPVFSAA